jgi:DNA-binding NtrC family response regulator
VPALRERRDEIPTLVDYFIVRYSRKYNRPVRLISDELRGLFLQYEFPGNIRELENMIKRIVVLQDEQLVIREIQQNLQRVGPAAAAQAAQAAAAVQAVAAVQAAAAQVAALPQPALAGAAAVPAGVMPGVPGMPGLPTPLSAPGAAPFQQPGAEPAQDEAEPAASGDSVSLAAVAKAAAMKAERAAIEHTLREVHWNRRKAAQILGVSYKTLLNKIKESGISRG